MTIFRRKEDTLGIVGALVVALATFAVAPSPVFAVREIAEEVVFGHYGTGIGEFLYPVGVAISPHGNIVISDNGKSIRRGTKTVQVHGDVSIYDKTGLYLGPVNAEGEDFGGPVGVCYDPAGNLYVVEIERHQVRKFNQAGKQVLVFGGPGRRPGRFRSPRGIDCDARGHVFVADYRNRRIQEFDGGGAFVRVIEWVDPTFGRPAQPRDVAVDRKGSLWAVFTANQRVVRFSADCAADLVIGTEGENLGQFKQPRYVAFDVRNNVYVADHQNHRIQKFADDGRFLYVYGVQGRAKGQLSFPEDVAVDDEGNIFIAEAGNKRVQVLMVKKQIRCANLGYLAFERREWARAVEFYEQVLQLDPANREALDKLEVCYKTLGDEAFAEGDLFKARRLYRQITQFHPSNVDINRCIRQTLWLQNKSKVYYLVLGFGILLTMIFLVITMVRIIRSD